MQFFLMYETGTYRTYYVDDHKRIVWRYLTGWFAVDLLSVGVALFDFQPLDVRVQISYTNQNTRHMYS